LISFLFADVSKSAAGLADRTADQRKSRGVKPASAVSSAYWDLKQQCFSESSVHEIDHELGQNKTANFKRNESLRHLAWDVFPAFTTHLLSVCGEQPTE